MVDLLSLPLMLPICKAGVSQGSILYKKKISMIADGCKQVTSLTFELCYFKTPVLEGQKR